MTPEAPRQRPLLLREGDRLEWQGRNGTCTGVASLTPSGRGIVLTDGMRGIPLRDLYGSRSLRIISTNDNGKPIFDMLKKDFLVVLNIAHSPDTAGKRSPDGTLIENSWSRDICGRVAERLRGYGFEVALVQQPDRNSLDKAIISINRLTHQRTALCLSIHVNAAGNGSQWYKATGWSAYTSVGSTRSDQAAHFLSRAAHGILAPKGRSIRANTPEGDSNFERDFAVLRKTACPCVLTENFFQDNRDDVAYLLSEEGREDITQLHVAGVIDYFKWLCQENLGR